MVSEEKRALQAFMAIQALLGISTVFTILAHYVTYLSPAILTPLAVMSTLLLPGFALTWAIEGASIWKRGKIRIIVWSILLSFGLLFPILLLLNLTVGIFVWQVLLLEQMCSLCFSAIGYKREKGALKALEQEARRICPNCRKPLRSIDWFCTNCGAKLKGEHTEAKVAKEPI